MTWRAAPKPLILILLLWLVLLVLRSSAGQLLPVAVWEEGGPPGTVVDVMAMDSGRLLAGGPLGLSESQDGGDSWERPTGPGTEPGTEPITALACGSEGCFAAGQGFLWVRSSDGWVADPTPVEGEVHHLLSLAGGLMAATQDGLFLRLRGGDGEWKRLWPAESEPPARANTVVPWEGRLLVGTDDGLLQMERDGSGVHGLGLAGTRVSAIAPGGSWIHVAVAAPNGGPARARVGSTEWQRADLNSYGGAADILVDPSDLSRLYAGLSGELDPSHVAGVVASTDSGANWKPLGGRLLNSYVPTLSLDADRGVLYAGTNGGGIFRHRLPTRLSQLATATLPLLDWADLALLAVGGAVLLLKRVRSAG